MILDTLSCAHRYECLHPSFAQAFASLRRANWQQLVAEAANSSRRSVRHEIAGDRIYMSVDCIEGRGREGARLEAHRRYVDIQFTIDGHEEIGWKPLAD